MLVAKNASIAKDVSSDGRIELSSSSWKLTCRPDSCASVRDVFERLRSNLRILHCHDGMEGVDVEDRVDADDRLERRVAIQRMLAVIDVLLVSEELTGSCICARVDRHGAAVVVCENDSGMMTRRKNHCRR